MDLRVLVSAIAVLWLVAACSQAQTSQEAGTASAPATPSAVTSEAQEQSDPEATTACGVPLPSDLATADLIAQTLVVFQPASTELDPAWASKLGGVFLEHTEMPPYLLQMKAESPFAPFIAVDDEGGRVQWRDDPSRPLPAALDLGSMSLDEVTKLVRSRGDALAAAGVDVTFAPVVDLYPGSRDGVIGDRAFSANPAEVVLIGEAYASAFEDAGLITTLKHFPGHGFATGDSHLSLPDTQPLQDLERLDLMPFRELVAIGPESRWVMMGHLNVPGMTSGKPASLSRQAYRYLREDLGHVGLVVTDEISGMQAIAANYDTPRAVIKALKAGADLVLIAQPGELGGLIAQVETAINSDERLQAQIDVAAQRVLHAKACARSSD